MHFHLLRFVALACVVAIGCSGELNMTGDNSGSPDGAISNAMVFRPAIQQDLDSAGCTAAACHGGTVAPMPLVAYPTTDADWMANYNQVMARAGTSSSSLLIDKAGGAGGHAATLTVPDPILDRWLVWLNDGARYEQTSVFPDAGSGGTVDAGAFADASAALTWEANIRPMLAARNCLSCHGSSGAYSLETYSAALGFGTDGIPNVIPGDPLSLLIIYCEEGHYEMPAADTLTVISWIVDYAAQEL